MRVIAGSARGRPLQAPPGRGVRPTSDRVKEALFSSLADEVPDARVLDLFAGSGALGIEALSRGADHAVLVERDPRALAVVRANLERTGKAALATVVGASAERFCQQPAGRFDIVLLDPPYEVALADLYGLLAGLRDRDALAERALVVVERDKRDPGLHAPPPTFLAPERRRAYGDTVLLYLRVQGDDVAGGDRERISR